jgi:hypothetical protein
LSVDGDSDWYGKKMVRALSENGITEAATRCGANIVSPDYINPDDMKMFVWSWDQQVSVKQSIPFLFLTSSPPFHSVTRSQTL